MAQKYYVKPIDNKIPCGGFSLMGGAVDGKTVKSNKYNSTLAQCLTEDDSIQRCLFMNLDDYMSICDDIHAEIFDLDYERYDIRFIPFDLQDYIKYVNIVEHSSDIVDAVNKLKKSMPKLCGGKAIDIYDLNNLYLNEIGLQMTTGDDPDGIELNDIMLGTMQSYYGTSLDILLSIKSFNFTTVANDVASYRRINIAGINFTLDVEVEEGHKNVLYVAPL